MWACELRVAEKRLQETAAAGTMAMGRERCCEQGSRWWHSGLHGRRWFQRHFRVKLGRGGLADCCAIQRLSVTPSAWLTHRQLSLSWNTAGPGRWKPFKLPGNVCFRSSSLFPHSRRCGGEVAGTAGASCSTLCQRKRSIFFFSLKNFFFFSIRFITR